jgi:hypothetical protein
MNWFTATQIPGRDCVELCICRPGLAPPQSVADAPIRAATRLGKGACAFPGVGAGNTEPVTTIPLCDGKPGAVVFKFWLLPWLHDSARDSFPTFLDGAHHWRREQDRAFPNCGQFNSLQLRNIS